MRALPFFVFLLLWCLGTSAFAEDYMAGSYCQSSGNTESTTGISLRVDANPPTDLIWGAFGTSYDQFMGVHAYANRSGGGGHYQCVELIYRFIEKVYGVSPEKLGALGNGEAVAKNLVERLQGISFMNSYTQMQTATVAYIENNCSSNAPVVGSVISLQYPHVGHVAVVRNIQNIDEHTIELTLFEQHGVMRLKEGQHFSPTKLIMHQSENGLWSAPRVVGWSLLTGP